MDKRGAALILSYMVIAVLAIFGSVFISRSICESNISRRYADSIRCFFVAEAGLARAYYAVINAQAVPTEEISFGGGAYRIVVSDAIYGKEIEVTADYGGSRRIIKGYVSRIPFVFDNTVSCGDDLSLSGFFATADINGKTRLSGVYSQSGGSASFDDLQEGVESLYTTLTIPDKNGNSVPDEFADFVLVAHEALASYPSEEVVYIESDDTVNIFPNSSLVGKRIIFVEGSSPGSGDVNIFFDGTWQEGEDLTVISTGDINYLQPLQFQADSRLSTISWGDFSKNAIFLSRHQSVIYTHSSANFVNIFGAGSTTGNIIADEDLLLSEFLASETFNFSARAKQGDLPPGFWQLAGSSGILLPGLSRWQEE